VGFVTSDLVPEMRAWRHGLHRQPELGFDVQSTATVVADCLRSFGLDEVHSGVGISGVVGVLRCGTSSKSIGLRADMDALPISEAGEADYRSEVRGAFHGCGHDGHTAMLLGAAKYLSARRPFDGVVHFLFQPDEENGRGAQAMIDDGLFERFPMSSIYGMHNKPDLPVGRLETREGPMMSSEDLFEVTIHGRGGHASTPERHVDPLVAAAQVILTLQTIVSRSVAAADTAVVSVTEITTDGARNIVPSTVLIKGDCRTFSSSVQETVEARMRQIVTGVCAAHGASGSVSYTHEFIPLVNTANEVRAAADAAAIVVGSTNVDTACSPVTASEDFARFLHLIPGCFVNIGNGVGGRCGASLHNPHYDFNDDILPIGADY
jgi:hippurate hydrolase